MVARSLPALPLELVDNILDLAMPETLLVHVNSYKVMEQELEQGGKHIYRVHTADLTSLLAIIARLRLSKYHRARGIKALNTITTLAVDMINNTHTTTATPPSFSRATTYQVSDAILSEIYHLKVQEAYSYSLLTGSSHQHLLSRRLTLSLSKPQPWAYYQINDFEWEYATHNLTTDAYNVLRMSKAHQEQRMRDSFDVRMLPVDRWAVSPRMLWILQGIVEVRERWFVSQGGEIRTEGKMVAQYWDEMVGEEGLKWEVEL